MALTELGELRGKYRLLRIKYLKLLAKYNRLRAKMLEEREERSQPEP